MKMLFACGGTGGHVYPAIALASELERVGGEAHFAGRNEGMESRLIGTRWPFHHVPAWPLKRGKIVENLRLPVRLVRSLLAARRMVREVAPDVVVGTGGYVSLPVMLAAAWMGKPIYIQEQNAVAGIANRVAGRWARRIFLAGAEGSESFHVPVTVSGNPIRELPLPGSLQVPAEFASTGPKILVLGGSQGARGVNDRLLAMKGYFASHTEQQWVWQSGPQQFEEVRTAMGSLPHVHVVAFIPEVYAYMLHADLLVCRAGASTLAELTAMGKPSILIPFPYATGNHQEHNARALERAGAAYVELEVEPAGLEAKLSRLLSDAELLGRMAQASAGRGRRDSAHAIIETILKEVRP
jgi:UDP-N-acetylglucosamine--N-acetylmuramyl-(pentapeptide) pyrophosphoryl-undecaprenol N-acetylglucosamine transferase